MGIRRSRTLKAAQMGRGLFIDVLIIKWDIMMFLTRGFNGWVRFYYI